MRKRYKQILLTIIIAFALLLLTTGYYIYTTVKSVSQMFKLNNELTTEGYYTSEFEFKMLGIAYYLDQGKYIRAVMTLHKLHHQLASKQGLVKIPDFANKKAELAFYLNLQNSKTGAFMDDSYPAVTYYEPTMNMLANLKDLAKETGQPLQLKYPLKFLNQINTKKTLTKYLNDLSTVGRLGSHFKAPFILDAKLTSYKDLEQDHLYSFSPQWEHTLITWFYHHQDPTTGFWGPELRGTGKILHGGDLGDTYSIVKNLFVDSHGNNLHPNFPLRYRNKMFATTVKKLAKPMPQSRCQNHFGRPSSTVECPKVRTKISESCFATVVELSNWRKWAHES